MSKLAVMTLLAALVVAAAGAAMAAMPTQAAGWLRRFPRSRYAAWALCAVDLAWSAWLLDRTPLGRFEPAKAYLWWAILPAATVLVAVFVDELLAPRALGGLLILLPAPLLDAARLDGRPARLLVVALAYAVAVAGIALVLSPFRFRLAAERMAGTPAASRRTGAVVLAAGAALALFALVAG